MAFVSATIKDASFQWKREKTLEFLVPLKYIKRKDLDENNEGGAREGSRLELKTAKRYDRQGLIRRGVVERKLESGPSPPPPFGSKWTVTGRFLTTPAI